MNFGSAKSRGIRHLDILLVLASLVAPVVLAVSISGQFVVLPVKLRVEEPIEDISGLGRATLLRVNLSNEGDRPIVPHFFVFWSGIPGNVFVPWSYGPNAVQLAGHSYGVYTIEAPGPDRAIPNGSLFYVRLYDEVTQEYAFSPVEKLVLSPPP